MIRSALAALLMTVALAAPVTAQDRAQTLADIKAELAQLSAEFNALKAELVTTGAVASGSAGGSALQRMDAMEAALSRLTAKAEEVELRVSKVVQDGTNRLGDLEFRLCEVTEGCDIGALGDTPPLGGAAPTAAAAPSAPAAPAAELAIGEQADFDRAKAALDAGKGAEAARLLADFSAAYPGSPLTQEAQVLRGDALASVNETADAARAYLEAFSSRPDGALAGRALLRLGEKLGALGQINEACVTLAEVGTRFPGSAEANEAASQRTALSCP